jgi:glycosyltransferase involved in cell wall biosynthesis
MATNVTPTHPDRIALYIANLSGGGAERVFVNLAAGLASRGLDVHLVVGNTQNSAYAAEVPSAIRVVDLGIRHMRAAVPGTVRYLRSERPAAIITAGDHSNVAAFVARMIARVPTRLVLTLHNTMRKVIAHDRSIKTRLTVCLGAWAARRADLLVAVSRGCAEDYAAMSGIPLERIKVIYNPVVSPTLYAKAAESPDHPWLDDGGAPVVLGMGRFSAQKDFPNLIRAFALVRATRPARLMILGEGKERPQLESLVGQLGIEADVALPGFTANPFAYLSRASVFVLSSAWEALPTVLIEALACGCPVVATDCPSGPREILQDGRLGRLAPVGNSEALAEAIRETLDAKEKRLASPEDLRPFTLAEATDAYLRVIGVAGAKEKPA